MDNIAERLLHLKFKKMKYYVVRRKSNMNKDLVIRNNRNDEFDCFARISKVKCSALKKKDCQGCSFYKDKNKMPNYQQYFNIKTVKE